MCLVLLLTSSIACGQADVARWVAAYALPQNTEPTAMAQTPDGFLWVGSGAGLFRFDGSNWLSVSTADPHHASISALLADPQGRLWVAGGNSLRVLAEGKVERVFDIDPVNLQIRRLRWLDGALHLATSNGIQRLDPDSGLVRLPGLEGKTVFDIAISPDDHALLAATMTGVQRRTGDSWQPLRGGDAEVPVLTFAQGSQGELWFGGANVRLLRNSAPAIPVETPAQRIREMAFLSNGELWLGTHADGLYIRDPNGLWRHGDRRLRGELVTAIFEDREANVWVATTGAGLQRFILTGMEVIQFEDGLPTKLLSGIAEGPDGNLWIATYGGGLVHLDQARTLDAVPTPCGDALQDIWREASDTLWLAGEGGLCRLHNGGRWTLVDPHPSTALAPVGAGGIWVLQNDRLQHRVGDRIAQNYPRGVSLGVAALLDAGDDSAWIGDENGLVHVGPAGWHRLDEKGPVRAILSADSGHLWLLQNDHLVLWGRDGSRRQTPALAHAWLLWRDGKGALWQIGETGVARVSERNLRRHLEAGKPAPEFDMYEAATGHEGARWAGVGLPRIIELDDGRAAFTAYGQIRVGRMLPMQPPPWRLTTWIDGASVPGLANAPAGQAFAPEQKPIRIDYTAASLRDPQAVRFRYRLLPLDAAWSPATAERHQSYPQLPPGAYRFELQARVQDVLAMPAHYEFTVLPRWQETWWARFFGVMILLICGGLAAFLLLRWRGRHMAQRQQELESLVSMRTRDLEDLNARLAQMARTDALTGLANRRVFMETLHEQWFVARSKNAPLAAMMIDVDHFKDYNDYHGHGAGDEALRRIAAALGAAVQRPGDLVARYGGEEFSAVLPDTDLESALGMAEEMRAAVAALAIPHAGRIDLDFTTVSIGVAIAMPATGEETMEHLLARADAALYEAKHGGRNCVVGH